MLTLEQEADAAERRLRSRAAMWIMYEFSVYRVSRERTFQRLREIGVSRRDAAEYIHDHEREG